MAALLAAVVAAPVAVTWLPTGVDQRETDPGPRSLAGATATGNATNVTSLRIARLHLRNVQVEFVTASKTRWTSATLRSRRARTATRPASARSR